MAHEPVPSVLASWVRTIVDAVSAQDIEASELLEAAGLAHSDLSDPNARLPVVAMARLWKRAAERIGDPAFGLRASKYIRHTTFHALGHSMLASATLQEAVERLVRFNHLVSDVAVVELVTHAESARLLVRLKTGYETGGLEAMDAILALIARALRLLSGERFPLEGVTMRRLRPQDLAPYERTFRCPVQFGCDVDALSFSQTLLLKTLPTGNPELARYSDAAVREYLARIEAGSLVDRVRATMAENMGGELSPELVAKKLATSVRSLQRSLKDHDTTYERLLRETREELACAYLREKRNSITEVAFLLGYENLGAFARAFKRWTGLSPSEYVAKT